MTLKEWYEFNKDVLSYSELFVSIYQGEGHSECDSVLESRMLAKNAVDMFGGFEITSFYPCHQKENDIATIVCLHKPNFDTVTDNA